jgi:hypothetical protein
MPRHNNSLPSAKHDRGAPWGLVLLLLAALAAWGVWWWWTSKAFNSWTASGPFGDTFGGINALFSAFAFAGIIYTIFLQRKELRYQRWELEATREELAGQREQLENQNATLLDQQFESTFFQMLRLHHDIVNGMTYHRPSGGPPIHGRAIFADIYSKIINTFPGQLARKAVDEAVIDAWEEVFSVFGIFLGHYFRNFYHLIKYVDEAERVLDKEKYTSLARAQLSKDEHTALFYNGIGRVGRKRFKKLMEKYHLLENLDVAAIRETQLLSLYTRSAYGDEVQRVEAVLREAGVEWPPDPECIATDP